MRRKRWDGSLDEGAILFFFFFFASREESLERKYEVKKKTGKAGLLGNLPNPKNHPPFLPKQYFSKPKIIAGSSFPF